MIQIGTANGSTLVTLSNTEFTSLAGQASSNIPDGAKISLAPIKAKLDLVDAKTEDLAELRAQCSAMISKLNVIGV